MRALSTAPLRGPGLERLRERMEVVLDPWLDHTPLRVYDGERLAARVRDDAADVLICEADFCHGPVFELPLVAIGSTRGDPTNVDVGAATAAGVPILYAPGRNADAVAEHTVALTLALARHIIPADRDVRRDTIFTETVPYQRYRAAELAGRTAGLVGLGAVGRAVRWRLAGLGMEVLAHDPFVADAPNSLEQVLAESDVVSLHAALVPETLGLIGAAELAAMRPGAQLVNTARAGLVDMDALVAALESGRLAGAALDHFDGERLGSDHPLVARDDVVLTPHIGGATYDTETNHTSLIVGDLIRLLEGERPHHIANPEVLGA